MKNYSKNDLIELGRSFQQVCILLAGAETGVFDAIGNGTPKTCAQIAAEAELQEGPLEVLLDALCALEICMKGENTYSLRTSLAPYLTENGSDSIVWLLRHQANCMRRWAELGRAVKTATMPPRTPSIRGEAEDTESFIGAMNQIAQPVADDVIASIGRGPMEFSHLLDIGGASGTWTISWLKRYPAATATLFDLPEVIPLAEARLAHLKDRVTLVPGDFTQDELPRGADLAWLSAIIHQQSRRENRLLFARIKQALKPGGTLLIRDVVMDESRTQPVFGALFAVNMLVCTERGGTFTYGEIEDDLHAAGFEHVSLLRPDEGMHSVVSAK